MITHNNSSKKEWDVFISHASEDKDTIVREITDILVKLNEKVWLDEISLNIGNSLTKSIDEGLKKSIANTLLGFSIGKLIQTGLSNEQVCELLNLWKKYYYDY